MTTPFDIPMPDPIISVSGLRGIIGESLTPDVVVRYIAAFLADLPAGPIVLSRDGRASGPMLADAVKASIAASGRETLYAGVAPTPTVGVLVREHGAAGGVQITASHNPPEYNGIKLFSDSGRVIPSAPGERVLAAYRAGHSAWATHERIGKVAAIADPLKAHLSLILQMIDRDRIAARKFCVLVDANHGSGGPLAARLLFELGCDANVCGKETTGQFAHPPEPTAENLQSVLAQVRNASAHVGFCLDPDADRLAVIDENGRYLGEELTLALCADRVLRHGKGPVVTNCSTSRVTEDLAAKYGVPFYRSKVGEANVVDLMREHNAILGGEGNGGVIDPRVGWVRDSFVAMAIILDAMAARGLPVSKLANELPQYAIHKTKAPLAADNLETSFAALKKHFADAKADDLDGLRLDWPGKWLLIRASNTEPIVRIIAEAEIASEAKRLCEEATRVISQD
jgi:phosphomannomutase